MKKCFLVLCSSVMLLSLTGCGSDDKLVCKKSDSSSGIDFTLKVEVGFDKDDKAEDVTTIMEYEFEDKELAEQYCDSIKGSAEENTKVKCSGKKITVESSANVDVDDVVGKTRDEIVKDAKADGFECK